MLLIYPISRNMESQNATLFFNLFLFISDCQSNNFLKRHVPFQTEFP